MLSSGTASIFLIVANLGRVYNALHDPTSNADFTYRAKIKFSFIVFTARDNNSPYLVLNSICRDLFCPEKKIDKKWEQLNMWAKTWKP